jgi:hypothetical protein
MAVNSPLAVTNPSLELPLKTNPVGSGDVFDV